jgi:hypothetical protein
MSDEPNTNAGGTSVGRVMLGIVAVFLGCLRLCARTGAFENNSYASSAPMVQESVMPGASGGDCDEARPCASGSDCLTQGGGDGVVAPVALGTCFHACTSDHDCTGGQHCTSVGAGQFCAFVADVGAPCDTLHVCGSGSSCLGLSLGAMSDLLAGRDPSESHHDVLAGECHRQCTADSDCTTGSSCAQLRDGRFCMAAPTQTADADAAVADDAGAQTHVRIAAHRRHASEHTPGR